MDFNDRQAAHTRFWQRYTRPPREEYWEYIVHRRDLLVPQDIRERKGSFFTPRPWVELSQEYLARALGESWQDEYYVWDCCAGTGNLLAGLTNKYHIYASTLDAQDVRVMRDLIAGGKLNLLDSHVFQFDFLNDAFTSLPPSLKDIINDPAERKKLVIYINPPYAEATTATTVTGTGKNKEGVAINNATYLRYRSKIGKASNELFAQFLIRLYEEIPGSIIANFSTLKVLQARNFQTFRSVFHARLCSLFVVPADTFDNVKGQFPIGFHIWNTAEKESFEQITADVYDRKGELIDKKGIYCPKDTPSINNWIIQYKSNSKSLICGLLDTVGNDFQHARYVKLVSQNFKIIAHSTGISISYENLIPIVVYLSVRHCIEATWLNDRDQFLYPKDTWMEDLEFQSDCLAYTLFHGQNRISLSGGVNHWIPFPESEVGARDRYQSHFMVDFLRGRQSSPEVSTLFAPVVPTPTAPIVFTAASSAVFSAAKDIYRYYHRQAGASANASFYDIRLFFKGTNDKDRMNSVSSDAHYTLLAGRLQEAMRVLAGRIAAGVYRHGFLLA